MTDYYSILRRAITEHDPHDRAQRGELYARARQTVVEQLQAAQLPDDKARAEIAALDAAIRRLEAEFGAPAAPLAPVRPAAAAARPCALRRIAVAVCALLLALAAGAYTLWRPQGQGPEIHSAGAAPPPAGAVTAPSEPRVSYVFARQPVYYRTAYPPGTLIIDKSQLFLYLVQPNVVALRYGLALGPDCRDAAGMRTVAAKGEPEAADRSYLLLDPGPLRLDGTHALQVIGSASAQGCFQVSSEDVADLSRRVPIGTKAIVAN